MERKQGACHPELTRNGIFGSGSSLCLVERQEKKKGKKGKKGEKKKV
jgi:hypothetical protein